MSVYVFVGPTLSHEEARTELDAIYLPPAAQGDVYRAALRRPQAIGIIDGYFERLPAVWHKEILWAMVQGIHVYGSASMGALRAAELAAFGMDGVGAIFEAYRDGVLEDDDEVAVAHGPAESGYRASSEAMVNIRRTLADAEAAAVIGPATRALLERIAKQLFYPERAYPLILRRAAEQGAAEAKLALFREWLSTGRADQKREDALAMLRVMRERLAANSEPKRVRFTFERTVWWETASLAAGELHLHQDGADSVLLEALLEEASLDEEFYARSREAALARHLAVAAARREGTAISPDLRQATADLFRHERGLLTRDETECWLAENHLTQERFGELLAEEALLEWVASNMEANVRRRLADVLRMRGQYPTLLARARDKGRLLAAGGWENPDLADTGLSREALLQWYFDRLGRPVEEDLERYARVLGFKDEGSFFRAVLREFLYVRSTRGEA
jgi:hypothetical protein